MKFVFLKSGDTIDFEPNPAKIITRWFNHLFSKDANLKFISSHNDSQFKQREIAKLNQNILEMNQLLAERIPDNKIFFEQGDTLDQQWLNRTHKLWAMLTAKYPNQINPNGDAFPNTWHEINHLVHGIETAYTAWFYNKNLKFAPAAFAPTIPPEDYTFRGYGLRLAYHNLGRHQFNQWSAGTIPDAETNNFNEVSYNFEYHYYMQEDATVDLPPPAYVEWCKQYGLEVVPPHISLGTFLNCDRHEVKKIIYRNLLESNEVGFTV